MAIRFQCPGCGKPFEVKDELAGKSGQCKQCGGRIEIPTPSRARTPEPEPVPELDVYGLSDDEPRPRRGPATGGESPRPGGGWATRPISEDAAVGPTRPGKWVDPSPAPKSARGSSGWSWMGDTGLKGIAGALFFVVLFAGRVYFRWNRNHARRPNNNPPAAEAAVVPGIRANLDGPIRVPSFPDLGPAREIAPGIQVREVVFGPSGQAIPPGTPPGFAGKIWVYTPNGAHAARSLPAVLMAPGGSNLITGMVQADEDRPQHLPYVEAGFAVVAYELDGYAGDSQETSEEELSEGAARFLAARAGLVNAHVAIEYALSKVPEIDPGRLATAGHSSAGTMAVLFAENEPRLKACVAFAPALNLPERFGPLAAVLRQSGLGPLVDRFSPSNGIGGLACPVFLGHARDDNNVPVGQSEQFADQARAQGKAITLDVVANGGHGEGMVRQVMPRAVNWLKRTLGPGSAN